MPRIAIVVPTHWEYLMGGAQLQAKLLIETLLTEADPQLEICYFASRTKPAFVPPENYQIVQIAKPNWKHRFGLFWDHKSLNHALDAFKPDVIYQRVATAYTGFCAYYAKQNAIPMIWHVANSTDCQPVKFDLAAIRRPHQYLEKRIIEYGLRNATQIVTQNADQGAQLLDLFGQSNFSLIRNFHPWAPPPRPKTTHSLNVLWIANLKDNKRPACFVELAERVTDIANIKLTMIGTEFPPSEQDKQAEIDERIDKLPNLDYLGALPLEQVNEKLMDAHVLVNTSTKEGFSNTFIQAWQRGVTVHTLGVNPDKLLDGGALGCAHSSVAEIADRLKILATQADHNSSQAQAARETAEKLFSMRNAHQLADLIRSHC